MKKIIFLSLFSLPGLATDIVTTSLPKWYTCQKAIDCAKVDFSGCGGTPLANKKYLTMASRYNHYMATVSNCAPAINLPKVLSEKIVCKKNVCGYEIEFEKNKK
jgi:hypothetical protein